MGESFRRAMEVVLSCTDSLGLGMGLRLCWRKTKACRGRRRLIVW